MSPWHTFTVAMVAAAKVRRQEADASDLSRQSEVRGAMIAADAQHACQLDAAEEKYKATLAQTAVAFEEACGLRPQ